ncbi:MAG TPA: hypothetical protein VML19_30820 [Verrucomicrobiae bacterium]|nr:hypothetical protein [Verrucomicrobiae bacterium]
MQSTGDAADPAAGAERKAYRWLLAAMGAYLAGLLAYSQTLAYTGDEGFHFLTNQLMLEGKRPYLDFVYPQALLNNLWNVLWMSVFGESWRAVHAITAVMAAAAVFLMADFVFRRLAGALRWRLAAALSVILIFGVNQLVVEYGTLGQAYGMCLFASAAAFRCALIAIEKRSAWMALVAGFFAGVAPASSLLTAAVPAVVVVWILLQSHAGNRWGKAVAAAIGGVIPFAPMIWLFTKGPFQVWFNLVEYHVFYRRLYWSETTQHDLEVMTSWIDSGQALLLGLLALLGLAYIAKRSSWTLAWRREFYLCGWLSVGMMAELAFAHPTFARYFLLAVPFLAVLAAIGLFAATSRLLDSGRPVWPVLLLAFLSLLNLGKSLYERRDMFTWPEYEEIAQQVLKVTPKGSPIWADEQMYFMTHIRPLPGMEFGYSHKVKLPPEKMALLHIISEAEETRRVKAHVFATAFACDSDDISDMGLNQLYSHKKEMYDCTVFWGDPPAEGEAAGESAKPSKKKP